MPDAVDYVVDSMTQSAEKVKKDVVDTFNKAVETSDNFKEKVKETFNLVSDTTKNFSESFTFDNVSEGAKKMADTVSGSLDKMPEKVKETLTMVSEGAQDLLGKVKENVGGFLDNSDKKTEETSASENPEYVEEEEVVEGDWKARKVEVKEIKVETGEEDEEVFWKQRSKLYRWATDTDGTGVWKERGLGESKLLKHKTTGKIRFLLRQEKTFKVVANHYVLERNGLCKLTPNVGSDKIWVWSAHNTLDEESKLEQLALKFPNVDQAKLFKEKFEEAAKLNEPLFGESQ
nr:Ran binding protein 1 [Theileria orientalis]